MRANRFHAGLNGFHLPFAATARTYEGSHRFWSHLFRLPSTAAHFYFRPNCRKGHRMLRATPLVDLVLTCRKPGQTRQFMQPEPETMKQCGDARRRRWW